jgi:hypothetical protein
MISNAIYSRLKQTDISGDQQKSKARAKEIWRGLSKEDREEVCNRAMITKSTVDRACRLGSISAKIVTAFADITGVDPRWVAARTDEKKNVTEAEIEEFLIDLGYKPVVIAAREAKPSAPSHTDGQQPDSANEAAGQFKSILDMARAQIKALSDEQSTSLESMSTEDMEFLINCLSLRARFNEDARALLGMLKLILIS